MDTVARVVEFADWCLHWMHIHRGFIHIGYIFACYCGAGLAEAEAKFALATSTSLVTSAKFKAQESI